MTLCLFYWRGITKEKWKIHNFSSKFNRIAHIFGLPSFTGGRAPAYWKMQIKKIVFERTRHLSIFFYLVSNFDRFLSLIKVPILGVLDTTSSIIFSSTTSSKLGDDEVTNPRQQRSAKITHHYRKYTNNIFHLMTQFQLSLISITLHKIQLLLKTRLLTDQVSEACCL